MVWILHLCYLVDSVVYILGNLSIRTYHSMPKHLMLNKAKIKPLKPTGPSSKPCDPTTSSYPSRQPGDQRSRSSMEGFAGRPEPRFLEQ